MEIERKFLVAEPPRLEGAPSAGIEQGYLSLGSDGEVRLRRRDAELRLTVKRGRGLVRQEREVELSTEQFEALWPLTDGRRLRKRRHLIPHGELTVELDFYEGELAGLVVAEVEFDDPEAAAGFEPPGWFGEELTGDAAYSNQRLAVEGRPR